MSFVLYTCLSSASSRPGSEICLDLQRPLALKEDGEIDSQFNTLDHLLQMKTLHAQTNT
jgi:hypothetical protein